MTRSAFQRISSLAGIVAAATLLAACSTTGGSADRSPAVSPAAIAARVDLGLEALERAHDKAALARRLAQARDYRPARWLAEQAEVDAELAVAYAAGNEARRAMALSELAAVVLLKTSFPSVSAGASTSAAKHNPRLEEVSAAHAHLDGLGIATLAPEEARSARQALERALAAAANPFHDPALVDHLAYVALQRAAIAVLTARTSPAHAPEGRMQLVSWRAQ